MYIGQANYCLSPLLQPRHPRDVDERELSDLSSLRVELDTYLGVHLKRDLDRGSFADDLGSNDGSHGKEFSTVSHSYRNSLTYVVIPRTFCEDGVLAGFYLCSELHYFSLGLVPG